MNRQGAELRAAGDREVQALEPHVIQPLSGGKSNACWAQDALWLRFFLSPIAQSRLRWGAAGPCGKPDRTSSPERQSVCGAFQDR